MPPRTPLEALGDRLAKLRTPGTVAARRTATARDLKLQVTGVGALRFPLARKQVQALAAVARPARFGKGEETLLDLSVRNCFEVPRSRVKIDAPRFKKLLDPMLVGLAADLGLPAGTRLKAGLQNLLIYGPGQFFARHQDSQKDPRMLGTLVLTLPSRFRGGEIVIEHQGQEHRFGATREPLSFLAFYADCYHEVRPVEDGYRVVLTYTLSLSGRGSRGLPEVDANAAGALVPLLRRYFDTPGPPRPAWKRKRVPEPEPPPDRMVFLLDHQYSEHGLAWDHLKGEDALRTATLRAAAEAADCESTLALAQLHESWECYQAGESYQERERSWRYGYRYEDDDEDDSSSTSGDLLDPDPAGYRFESILESEATLDRWLDPDTGETESLSVDVDEAETCYATPCSSLRATEADYEGYMGNYGNTMDRWYRRAAILVWPRARGAAFRAAVSPGWALRQVRRLLDQGEAGEAATLVATLIAALLPTWPGHVSQAGPEPLIDEALPMVLGVDSPDLATSLLTPFGLETVTPGRARPWMQLVRRYGQAWWHELLGAWSRRDGRWRPGVQTTPSDWMGQLPALTHALAAADRHQGPGAVRLLLQDRWTWLRKQLDADSEWELPSERAKRRGQLAGPLRGLLEAAFGADAADLVAEVEGSLTQDPDGDLLPIVLEILALPGASPALAGLREHARARITEQLASPPRAADDWSLALPKGCRCALCRKLEGFLQDRNLRVLEWPLAKDGRQHIHRRVERHELPVDHVTRRTGRPFTLVLTKREQLFRREAARRKQLEVALARLRKKTKTR